MPRPVFTKKRLRKIGRGLTPAQHRRAIGVLKAAREHQMIMEESRIHDQDANRNAGTIRFHSADHRPGDL
jgi:hypothetical protein